MTSAVERIGPMGLLLAVLAAAPGCGHAEEGSAPVRVASAGLRQRPATSAPPTAAPPAPALAPAATAARVSVPDADPREPLLAVTDPGTLQALEAAGLGFGPAVLGHAGRTTAQLAVHPDFAALAAGLADDIAAARRRDPRAGVGMAFSHRLFDLRWLRDARLRLELIAVVNRLDRQPFGPGTCGETRLVYRLAYTTSLRGRSVSSRLPLTVNAVFFQPGQSPCTEALAAWRPPAGADAVALARFLRSDSGALSSTALAPARLKSVELNAQTVRWPSTARPDLAGHAEYSLRVFRRAADGRLRPDVLENTPDVARLLGTPALRQALLEWLRQPAQLARIDQGTAVLPTRFLADRATSVAPLGLGRLGNRPFAQLFEPADFADLELGHLATVRTPAGLLRRLDGLTCAGCHQSRSIAGFHLLGAEPAQRTSDALAVVMSPHATDDLARRQRWLRLAAGGGPIPELRPPAERDAKGGYGARCGMAWADAAFAAWTCAEPLVCTPAEEPGLGHCLPRSRGVGDPCQPGALQSHADPHRDGVAPGESERRVDLRAITACPGGFCESRRVGFPGGMCATACGSGGPGATCGAIPRLVGFNRCVAARRPFEDCVAEHARPAAVRGCGPEQPCRDDYVCARAPNGQGACMPPYFLFQLRVDGHVL